MYYLLVALGIVALVLVGIRRWLISYRPSTKRVLHLQEKILKCIETNKLNEAGKSIHILVNKQLGYPKTAFLQAKLLHKTGQSELALQVLDKTLRSYPDNKLLQMEQARILLFLDNSKGALEIFEQCKSALQSESDIIDFVIALLSNGQVNEAWWQLNPYLQETTNGHLLFLAGECRYYKKQYVQAILLYRRAQKNGWTNKQTMLRLAYCFRNLRHLDKAAAHFEKVLSRDLQDLDAALGLGSCFEMSGEYDKALMCYQEPAIWDQGDGNIMHRAGICSLRLGYYEYAENYLRGAIKSDIVTPKILTLLGYSLECQNKWEEAEKVYIKLTEHYPNNVLGYRALAWLYAVGLSSQIDSSMGIHLAEKSLELQNDDIGWEILSGCEARAGNFAKAHDIREKLSSLSNNQLTSKRHRSAMKMLRQRIPLTQKLVMRQT